MSTKQYTYLINVRDKLSPALQKVKGTGESTYSRLNAGQQRFNERMQQGSTAAQGMHSRLLRMVGTYMTLGAGIMFARNSLNKWNTQAQAEAQVMQGIASTNNAAGRSFEQLTAAARELQSKTIFGDEAILQGVTAQMLTFTNITGTAFDRVQQAALDVTSRLYGTNATAESLRSTSIQLGKALNDPVANLGALSRSGIQFSESQKEVIKNLWKTGRQAEAQALILDELNQQYGGSAEAAAKTGLGAWMQFMNKIGDQIQERLGPYFNLILNKLISLASWVKKNITIIGAFAVSIGGAIAVYKGIIVVTKLWTAAQWAYNAAMNANPMMLIVTLIGALIAAVIYAWYKFDGFRGAVFGLWEAFKKVFTGIKDLVKGTMGGVGELILGALTFDIDRIRGGLRKLGESFAAYGTGIADAYKVGSDAGKAFQPKVPNFLSGITGGAAGTGAMAGGMGNLDNINDGIGGDTVQQGISGITGGGSKSTNITVNLGKLQDQIVIHAQGIGEGIDEMEAMVTEALLRVLNSANKIATQ